MARSSFKVIYAALFGNLAIALMKFGAAWLTGSSAMTSEAVHSVVDTGNEVLLLYGIRRAAQPPDEFHPFGHGRELYFWSFIVAVLVFALGAGIAVYHGVERLLHPKPIIDPVINYVVLGFSFLFEGISWRIALKEFRPSRATSAISLLCDRARIRPRSSYCWKTAPRFLESSLRSLEPTLARR